MTKKVKSYIDWADLAKINLESLKVLIKDFLSENLDDFSNKVAEYYKSSNWEWIGGVPGENKIKHTLEELMWDVFDKIEKDKSLLESYSIGTGGLICGIETDGECTEIYISFIDQESKFIGLNDLTD